MCVHTQARTHMHTSSQMHRYRRTHGHTCLHVTIHTQARAHTRPDRKRPTHEVPARLWPRGCIGQLLANTPLPGAERALCAQDQLSKDSQALGDVWVVNEGS